MFWISPKTPGSCTEPSRRNVFWPSPGLLRVSPYLCRTSSVLLGTLPWCLRILRDSSGKTTGTFRHPQLMPELVRRCTEMHGGITKTPRRVSVVTPSSSGILRSYYGLLRAPPGSSGVPPAFSGVSPAFSGVSPGKLRDFLRDAPCYFRDFLRVSP